MTIKFLRNPNLEGPCSSFIYGLGPHALGREPASLAEIMREHRTYQEQFVEAGCPTWAQLLHDLSFMVETGMVSVIESETAP